MSVTPASCPALEALEEHALGQGQSDELRAHLEVCAACRDAVARMQADNRFLMDFAVDGSLALNQTERSPREIDIPGYQLVREIQHGGQGVVWLALQRSTKRHVAIKLMKQGPFATLSDRARFDREIETLSRLNHPNIVAVHDAGVAGGYQYFVMDYFEGVALDEALPGWGARIHEQPARDADARSTHRSVVDRLRPVLTTFIKVCDAVHAAHLRGVIHRDLKPSNIRVDTDGDPHVLDFGLAKSTLNDHHETITQTGQFVGSLPWAAPEQVEGTSSRIDLRTDVYALGVMLFQLVTGELPIEVDSNLRETVDNILHREPPAPSSMGSSARRLRVDDELDTIILKCLSKERDRRYQTAGELARDLRRYLAGEPIEAKRDSAIYLMRKTLHRYRLRVAAAGAFVVLLGVFAVVMTLLYRESTQLEQEATQSASSLAQLLAQSNIEQGRMAGMLGNMEQAEQLLWDELLTRRAPRGDAAFALNDPPGPREAYWALWGLYRRFPCEWTASVTDAVARTMTMGDDGQSVWTVNGVGEILRLDERGEIAESFSVVCSSVPAVMLVTSSGESVVRFDGESIALWQRGSHADPSFSVRSESRAPFESVIVSPSGRRIVGICGGEAVVWDVENTQPLARFKPADTIVSEAAVSNSDALLAVRDQVGTVYVWEIATQRLVSVLKGQAPPLENLHPTGRLLFSPDDAQLADLWTDIPGRIWDLRVDPPRATLLAETPGDRRTAAFSADGSLLAVGDLVGAVRVFDARTGARRAAFIAHPERIWNVGFVNDDRALMTCSARNVRRWEMGGDGGVNVLTFEGDGLHGVAISPDGGEYFAGGGLGVLRRIDAESHQQQSQSFGNDATISSVAVSADGERLAVSTYGAAVYVWDELTSESPPRRLAHPFHVSHLAFSPDGAVLATACDDGHVRVWGVDDGEVLHTYSVGSRIPQVAFDPGGAHVAAAVRDGSLHTWDLASGVESVWINPTPKPLRTVRYSPDGKWLYAAGADRHIVILDVATRREVAALEGHNQEIYDVEVSAGGGLIASGDTGGTIRLWSASTRQPLATLDGHTGAVMGLRFTPDGGKIVSVG